MKTNWEHGPLILIVALFFLSLVVLVASPGAGFTYQTTPRAKTSPAAGGQSARQIGSSDVIVLAREKTPDNSMAVATNSAASGVLPIIGGIPLTERNIKVNLGTVDGREILDKVATLPMTTWKYRGQERPIRHMGPVGENFKAAFGLGDSDAGVALVDESGVALAAIQGLNEKVELQADQLKARDAKIQSLEQRLSELEKLITMTVRQH